jgi:hypothetical protein
MKLALTPLLGKEVKAVGFERSQAFAGNNWSKPDRWHIDMNRIKDALSRLLTTCKEPDLPNALVLQIQVYDFAVWGDVFGRMGFGSSYVRSSRQLTLSVQLDYAKVKKLTADKQFGRVRSGLVRAARAAEQQLNVPKTISLPHLRACLTNALSEITLNEVIASAADA